MSTMEAETIDLASFCRELFPIMDLVTKIVTVVGMPAPDPPRMHSQRQLWSIGICNYHFTSIYSLKQVSCNQDYLVLRENN
jgi:hypothetical protein